MVAQYPIAHGILGIETEFKAVGVNFNGVNTYLSKPTAFNGASNGTAAVVSLWFKLINPSGIWFGSYESGLGVKFGVYYSSNKLEFIGRQVNGTNALVAVQDRTFTDTSSWHHLLWSFELQSAANRYVYIDDVFEPITYSVYTNQPIDFEADIPWGVNSNFTVSGAGGALDMSELWYHDVFLSESQANRRKFINEEGKPVFLGDTGEIPLGFTPRVFQSGPVSQWHNNKGAGGGFTENGALTESTTSPSD